MGVGVGGRAEADAVALGDAPVDRVAVAEAVADNEGVAVDVDDPVTLTLDVMLGVEVRVTMAGVTDQPSENVPVLAFRPVSITNTRPAAASLADIGCVMRGCKPQKLTADTLHENDAGDAGQPAKKGICERVLVHVRK